MTEEMKTIGVSQSKHVLHCDDCRAKTWLCDAMLDHRYSSSRRDYYDDHAPPRPDRDRGSYDRGERGQRDNKGRYRKDEVDRYGRDEGDRYRRGKRERSHSPATRRGQGPARSSRRPEADEEPRGRQREPKEDRLGQEREGGEEEGEAAAAAAAEGEGGDAEAAMMDAMGFGGFGSTKVRSESCGPVRLRENSD